MSPRIAAFTWHQRTAAIDTRERLLATLTGASDRVVLATCHRVEVYVALPDGLDPLAALEDLRLDHVERGEILEGAAAIAHLFTVAAGLDSSVIGEPQILAQVRRAAAATSHPLLVAALGRALHVGRSVRARCGLTSTRSVGSLAVDELLSGLARPREATVLVIGAGEMGKLAIRALARRVAAVVIANRDIARAVEVARSHGARAVGLDDIPSAIAEADAVVSAADTRGAVLTTAIIERRLRSGPFALVDIAMPRSVAPEARELLGPLYRSVDDLPGSRSAVPDGVLAEARVACDREAARFMASRAPEHAMAIRALRDEAEAVRAAKLARALRRLRHLSERDRRVVASFSASLTNALLHAPTVALRERALEPR